MTMGRMILTGSLNMMPLNIAKTALTPISAAFAYWMRCSEFSADRAAILCDGTPDKTFEVFLRELLEAMYKELPAPKKKK